MTSTIPQYVKDRVDGKTGPPNPPMTNCLPPSYLAGRACGGRCVTDQCVPCVMMFETSNVAHSLGRIPGKDWEDKRKPLLMCALFSSILCAVFSFLAAFASLDSIGLVKAFQWTHIKINFDGHEIEVWAGLNGRVRGAVPELGLVDEQYITFAGTACADVGTGGGSADMEKYCQDCSDVSAASYTLGLMGFLGCFGAIFTDINRMYPNYDIYCVKMSAVLMALHSTLSLFSSIGSYSAGCMDSFPETMTGATVVVSAGT